MPKSTFFNIDEEKKERIIEAAFDEFAARTFREAKLSNIIRAADIPRGSFYQYFEDKKDLYKYIFDILAAKKMEFMDDLLPNPTEMPFMKLFEELYLRGIKFAESDPRFIKISRNLLISGGEIVDFIFGDNLKLARQFYINYIETDKKLGRIREDVNTELLADIVIQTTTNVAFEEIARGEALDMDKMYKRITSMIQILKKGIE